MTDLMPPRPASTGLSAKSLIDELLASGKVATGDFPRLFGPNRHKITIPRIERGIDGHSVMADSELAALKSRLAGLPVVPLDATPQKAIDHAVAQRLKAVALLIPSMPNRPAVAVVEPRPEILGELATALGTAPGGFDVYITTVRGFGRLFGALVRADEVAIEQPLPEIWELLDRMVVTDASDLHLAVGTSPRLRDRGSLEPLEYEPVNKDWLDRQLGILVPHLDVEGTLKAAGSLNPAVAFGTHRFRCVISQADNGPSLVARKLSSQIPTMDDIGLPRSVQELIQLERGLVLVTGPTGSGKSTTLASMLQTLLMTQRRSVLTLEEPIEYRLAAGTNSIVYQREKGRDFTSFHDGVVTGLRMDPDVILIGEMRDDQTVKAALEAAETGHLVFGTLHTYDAAATIQRVSDFFQAEQQDAIRGLLSYVLEGVVSQTLLPVSTGTGRVGAYEVMKSSTAIRHLMKTIEGIGQIRGQMEISQKQGMQTLEQDLAKLVRAQRVERSEAEFKARDIEALSRLLDNR